MRRSRIAVWMALLLIGGCLSFPSYGFPRIPIEGRGNQRWFSLEQRLAELRFKRGMPAVRILQLGDSHTAGIYFPMRMRSQMCQHFGCAGIGILPPGKLDMHPPIAIGLSQTSQWAARQLPRHDRAAAGSASAPAIGLGGFVGYGVNPYQMVTYEIPRRSGLARFIVYWEGPGQGGRAFRLYDGDRELWPSEQGGGSSRLGRSVFHLHGTEERLTLVSRGDAKQFRLLGVSALSFGPGVMFSRIGLNGATFGVLNDWDSEISHAQLVDYAPHLVILVFGTNDVVNARFSEDRFRNELLRTSDWIARHAPDGAVLLVMPPHAPMHGETTNLNLRKARTIMRQVADERGWRTWDWSALTAADCMLQCKVSSGEPMFQPDGIHLTRKGYEASADALVEAISSLATPRY